MELGGLPSIFFEEMRRNSLPQSSQLIYELENARFSSMAFVVGRAFRLGGSLQVSMKAVH